MEPPLPCAYLPADKKQKTKVINNNLDPEWNETFTWALAAALAPSDQLQVEVYDYEKIGRKRQAVVPYRGLRGSCRGSSPPSLLAPGVARKGNG